MTKTKKVKKEEVVAPAVEQVEIKPVKPKEEKAELQKVWDAYKAQYPEKAAFKEKLFKEGLAPNSILSKLENLK